MAYSTGNHNAEMPLAPGDIPMGRIGSITRRNTYQSTSSTVSLDQGSLTAQDEQRLSRAASSEHDISERQGPIVDTMDFLRRDGNASKLDHSIVYRYPCLLDMIDTCWPSLQLT
jgi:hypothetical protein